MKSIEADRLMMAQQVELFIVGVMAHFLTRFQWPESRAEKHLKRMPLMWLLAAGNGDRFVVHALADRLCPACHAPTADTLSWNAPTRHRVSNHAG